MRTAMLATLLVATAVGRQGFAEEVQFGWNGSGSVPTLYSQTEAFTDICHYDCIEGTGYLHLINPGHWPTTRFYHYLAWANDLRTGDVISASLWHYQWATSGCTFEGVRSVGSADLCVMWTNGTSFQDIIADGPVVIDNPTPSSWKWAALDAVTPSGATGAVLAVRTYINCDAGFHCLVDDLQVSIPGTASITLPSGAVAVEHSTFGDMKARYR